MRSATIAVKTIDKGEVEPQTTIWLEDGNCFAAFDPVGGELIVYGMQVEDRIIASVTVRSSL